MPSRRHVLAAAAGLATAGSVASSGCLTALGAAETGFLSYKGVEVEWEHRGRRASAALCWVLSDGRERVFGWVDEGYAEVVRAPTDVWVSEAVDARLRRAFLGVTYHLGFSRPGSDNDLLGGDWYVARTSRGEFDRVRFGDPADWSAAVGTMDFEELYRERDRRGANGTARRPGRDNDH